MERLVLALERRHQTQELRMVLERCQVWVVPE